MNFKTLFLKAFTLCAILVLASCQSQEERIISKINNLAERIEKNGENFDEQDWEDAINDYEKIHEDMQNCEFTNEELRELGKAERKITLAFASEGAKAFGKGMKNFMGGLGAFASGFTDLDEDEESENAKDLEELEKDIEEGVDEFMKEFGL